MSSAAWWGLFAAVTIARRFGDVAVKRASVGGGVDWRWLGPGFTAYLVTSAAWFFLLRDRRLSFVGVVAPLASALGLVVLGSVVFGEHLTTRAWAGVVLGLAAVLLLSEGP